jgi:hypothetical protein
MFFGGFFVFFLAALSGLDAASGLFLAGLCSLVGLGVAWYGNQLVEKAKHIAWTKEALSEYERARTRTLRDINAGSNENGVHFVTNCSCGHRIDTYATAGERLQCSQCGRRYTA